MLFWSHPFNKLHIAMSSTQHGWINGNSCACIRITRVCINMYICVDFYVLLKHSGSYILFIISCPELYVCLLHESGHWLHLHFDIFHKNTFSYCAVVCPKVRAPKCYFWGPVFWTQMYTEVHFCWRNLLAVVFHFHLSIYVFSMTLRNKAGIAGISEPAVPLKSFSLLSPSTLSILIKPVYASWS